MTYQPRIEKVNNLPNPRSVDYMSIVEYKGDYYIAKGNGWELFLPKVEVFIAEETEKDTDNFSIYKPIKLSKDVSCEGRLIRILNNGIYKVEIHYEFTVDTNNIGQPILEIGIIKSGYIYKKYADETGDEKNGLLFYHHISIIDNLKAGDYFEVKFQPITNHTFTTNNKIVITKLEV